MSDSKNVQAYCLRLTIELIDAIAEMEYTTRADVLRGGITQEVSRQERGNEAIEARAILAYRDENIDEETLAAIIGAKNSKSVISTVESIDRGEAVEKILAEQMEQSSSEESPLGSDHPLNNAPHLFDISKSDDDKE